MLQVGAVLVSLLPSRWPSNVTAVEVCVLERQQSLFDRDLMMVLNNTD